MMIKLTQQNGHELYVRQSAVLSVYSAYRGTALVTCVQIGHTWHDVQESVEDVMKYFDI